MMLAVSLFACVFVAQDGIPERALEFGTIALGDPLGDPLPDMAGGFYLPAWGYNPGSSYDPLPTPASSQIGICFGGSSDMNENALACGPTGTVLTPGTVAGAANWVNETEHYYSFGGGGGSARPDLNIDVDYLRALNSGMTGLKEAGYNGIFYDVECIKQASHMTQSRTTYEDFKTSFEAASAAGLKVILGTSYAAPMTLPDAGTGGCSDAEPDTASIWKQMIRDPNVYAVSPQFYGDGHTATIVFGALGQTQAQLADYGSVEVTAKIMPTLKAWSADYWAGQVAQMKNACDGQLVTSKMCDSGYFLWPGN